MPKKTIEINDQQLEEAVRSFEELNTSNTWKKASVERYKGLTLVNKSGQPYHFKTPTAGGFGPAAETAADILAAAGFGDRDSLLKRIKSNELCTFGH